MRESNKALRPREYLKPDEMERLMVAAAKAGRYGHRDATLMLLTYRHGLRVSELVALRWDQVDLKSGLLHVNRNKNGIDSVQPLRGPELRALRRMQREGSVGAYVFMTERGGPMTTDNVRKLVQRAGQAARLPFSVHPHMLRHACGYKLSNDGHDTRAIQQYLGHKNIQHTVRYTELSPQRFKNFWKD
ncbi:MAG: tyrosine-type recombinase/integrase [Betaproteobacteria bacterium]